MHLCMYMIESHFLNLCFLQYSFSPQVLYCFSTNLCPISQDASYTTVMKTGVCVCVCVCVCVMCV